MLTKLPVAPPLILPAKSAQEPMYGTKYKKCAAKVSIMIARSASEAINGIATKMFAALELILPVSYVQSLIFGTKHKRPVVIL